MTGLSLTTLLGASRALASGVGEVQPGHELRSPRVLRVSMEESCSPAKAESRRGPLGRFRPGALIHHQAELFKAPFRLPGRSWVRWAPPLVLAGGLMLDRGGQPSRDEDFYFRMQRNRAGSPGRKRLSRNLSRLADPGPGLGLLGATWLIGQASDRPRLKETALMSTEAFVDSGVLAQLLKTATGRARPSAMEGEGSYLGGPIKSGELGFNSSFPSGHSMAAFSVATVVAGRSKRKWVAPVAYAVASGVALSRAYEGQHYLSDVIVGGIVGHGLGRVVLKRHRSSDAVAGRRWDVLPAWSPGDESVRLVFSRRPSPWGGSERPSPRLSEAELRPGERRLSTGP